MNPYDIPCPDQGRCGVVTHRAGSNAASACQARLASRPQPHGGLFASPTPPPEPRLLGGQTVAYLGAHNAADADARNWLDKIGEHPTPAAGVLHSDDGNVMLAVDTKQGDWIIQQTDTTTSPRVVTIAQTRDGDLTTNSMISETHEVHMWVDSVSGLGDLGTRHEANLHAGWAATVIGQGQRDTINVGESGARHLADLAHTATGEHSQTDAEEIVLAEIEHITGRVTGPAAVVYAQWAVAEAFNRRRATQLLASAGDAVSAAAVATRATHWTTALDTAGLSPATAELWTTPMSAV